MLKKACLEAPALAFADFNKLFLLETDASKLGLGAVLSQRQADGQYHPVAYPSQSLTVHEHKYHSTKQEFLALTWVIAEQFQKYLLWKPFFVKINNKPLTYVITAPNLDTTQHRWVGSIAGLTISITHQKGWDNATTDALSQVTSKLDVDTMKSILNWVTVGTTWRADAHDPVVAETNKKIHKQVWQSAVQARATDTNVNLHVTDLVAAQQEDHNI